VIKTPEVIWIYDKNINPNDWKMFVCVEPDCLFFFRINSIDHWKPAVRIEKEPHHAFLKYDSYVECNLPQEITEYDLEQSLKSRGVIGRVHRNLAPSIYATVKDNVAISVEDKRAIGLALVGEKNL
jgi:hypothetical protein